MPELLVPWTKLDWGVGDVDPLLKVRRRYGKWRAVISRRLTAEEQSRMSAWFRLHPGKTFTLAHFAEMLPPDVKILRSRGQLGLGALDEDPA